MNPVLQVLLDKGLAPVCTLAGVAMTLLITGRRERERHDREQLDKIRQEERDRAARLRDRRVQLYLDVSGLLQDWRTAIAEIEQQRDDEGIDGRKINDLMTKLRALNGPMMVLAPAGVDVTWYEFTSAAAALWSHTRNGGDDPDETVHRTWLNQARDFGSSITHRSMLLTVKLRETMAAIESE